MKITLSKVHLEEGKADDRERRRNRNRERSQLTYDRDQPSHDREMGEGSFLCFLKTVSHFEIIVFLSSAGHNGIINPTGCTGSDVSIYIGGKYSGPTLRTRIKYKNIGQMFAKIFR